MELLTKFRFVVSKDGQNLSFSEVSGLNMETEVIEYRSGNSPDDTKVKLPGLKKYSNVTMKRGMTKGDNSFYAWWGATAGKDYKKDITISMLNEENAAVVTWTLSNAWPIKVDATDLKADGSEVAIETIEWVHEGFSMVEFG